MKGINEMIERKLCKSYEEARKIALAVFTENEYITEIKIGKKKNSSDWEVRWHSCSISFIEKFIKNRG